MGESLYKCITRNSEYSFRGGICVEVRERKTGHLRTEHLALDQQVVARVRWRRDGSHQVLFGGAPEIGDSILLGVSDRTLLTSQVQSIT